MMDAMPSTMLSHRGVVLYVAVFTAFLLKKSAHAPWGPEQGG
jgi:hypothetical protein